MKEKFGEYIHNLSVKYGLALTKLSAALNIDQSTLSKIAEMIYRVSDFTDLLTFVEKNITEYPRLKKEI